MAQTFRKNLSDLRQKRQFTQKDLARKIGVTRQDITTWERGDGVPNVYHVSKLIKALDVTLDELIGEDEAFNKKEEPKFIDLNQTGNYLKKLLYKVKHPTNAKKAKVIRSIHIILGIMGIITGGLMLASGFTGFISGAVNTVNTIEPFNPVPFIGLFALGGIVLGISIYLIYDGLTIVATGVATNDLETKEK